MNFQEALRLKTGDKVYTHLGKIVVISGWHQNFENPCIKDDLYFHCIDTSLNSMQYRYDELCGPELCDEDKIFIEWYINNGPKNEDMLPYLKASFMEGFKHGYSHKQRMLSQDQLQK